MNSKVVLVTGANGFTGAYVCAELVRRGYLVHKLVSDLLNIKNLEVELMSVCPAYCIHLAGIAFTQHSNIRQLYEVNLIGTLNLLSVLSNNNLNVHSILLASSGMMYKQCSNSLLDENTPVLPHNHYSASKLAMEYATNVFRDSLPLIVVRPFNYTGVNQSDKFLVPKIVNHFKDKKSVLKIGNTKVYREFNDVRDVASVYVDLILNVGSFLSPINICSGIGIRVGDIISLCSEISNFSPKIEVDPRYVREGEPHKIIGNNSLLETLVPIKNRFDISETLSWMLQAD
jgi:GDP-6-deoxy-D-talose 4-dehydrogenase